jgi:hypothetical protein
MNNKYEQLVEFIINDETDKARELFHEIVVEKSRDIYENLVAEEDLDEVGGNEVQGLVKDVQMDEEGISEEEEEEGEGEDLGALDAEEPAGEEQEEAEIEDRVVDLESALEELKAEFDALMAGEEHEEEVMPGIHGDEGHEEMGGEEQQSEFFEAEEKEEDDEEDDEEEEDLDETIVREYVEKVGDTGQKSESGKMSASGAKTPASGGKNTKSAVAGKNDMGGTAAFTKGGNQDENGTTPNASVKPKGELVSNPQNKPGANAGKTAFKAKEAQQGGQEGKLAGADGSRPINKVSPVAK